MIFQTLNAVRSNDLQTNPNNLVKPVITFVYIVILSYDLSLKYQKFTTPGCKDIWIRKFLFVTKTQFYLVDVLKAEAEPPGLDFCVLPTEVNFGDGGRVKYIQVIFREHWSTFREH